MASSIYFCPTSVRHLIITHITAKKQLIERGTKNKAHKSNLSTQEKGVHRVAVGIGKKIKQAELITIAGDENRVVNAKNVEDLNNQLDDIRKATCSKYHFNSIK